MAKRKIQELVSDILSEFLTDNGYELYHVEYCKEAKDWFLRVYIDIAGQGAAGTADMNTREENAQRYIGTEDCEKVSRFLSDKLDEEDPIGQNYFLEVSSPGMDRELITEEHYRRYTGHDADISLYKAVNGEKNFTARLKSVQDGSITFTKADGTDMEMPMDQIAKARLTVTF